MSSVARACLTFYHLMIHSRQTTTGRTINIDFDTWCKCRSWCGGEEALFEEQIRFLTQLISLAFSYGGRRGSFRVGRDELFLWCHFTLWAAFRVKFGNVRDESWSWRRWNVRLLIEFFFLIDDRRHSCSIIPRVRSWNFLSCAHTTMSLRGDRNRNWMEERREIMAMGQNHKNKNEIWLKKKKLQVIIVNHGWGCDVFIAATIHKNLFKSPRLSAVDRVVYALWALSMRQPATVGCWWRCVHLSMLTVSLHDDDAGTCWMSHVNHTFTSRSTVDILMRWQFDYLFIQHRSRCEISDKWAQIWERKTPLEYSIT